MANNTYIDFSRLENKNLTIELDIEPTTEWLNQSVVEVFARIDWLQMSITLLLLFTLYQIFRKQSLIPLTNSQIYISSTFLVFLVNIFMLYSGWWTSIQPLALTFVLWFVAVIMTIKK